MRFAASSIERCTLSNIFKRFWTGKGPGDEGQEVKWSKVDLFAQKKKREKYKMGRIGVSWSELFGVNCIKPTLGRSELERTGVNSSGLSRSGVKRGAHGD